MAVLKVYGGLKHMGSRGQLRTIVATTSKAKAAELVGLRPCEVAGYWSVTGNKTELDVALAAPGQVFQASSSMGKDFTPVDLRRVDA
jgi:hypothetical protein